MTQKEKQLLLTDLSARLPYGVMVQNAIDNKTYNLKKYIYCLPSAITTNYKPYLRPMSSMTEEEKNEYSNFEFIDVSHFAHAKEAGELTNWLNKNHFDYRGLIPLGLALEAPKDMYKNNIK